MDITITRDGILMPPKIYCNRCLTRMMAKPARHLSSLVDLATRKTLIAERQWEALKVLHEQADSFMSFSLGYSCATCDACGTGGVYLYSEDEIETVVNWHNSDDYVDDIEKAWAERHKPLPGYNERFIAVILEEFPEWDEYLYFAEEKGDFYPIFILPDPKPERDMPLTIDTRFACEILIQCGDPHAHIGISPADRSTWQEAEKGHFDRAIELLRSILSEEIYFYDLFVKGESIGGGFGNKAHMDTIYDPFSRKCDQIRFRSWLGTHDQTILL